MRELDRLALIARALALREAIAQFRTDANSWNDAHPGREFDPDPDGKVARAEEYLAGLMDRPGWNGATAVTRATKAGAGDG